jgi:hypothetical protein
MFYCNESTKIIEMLNSTQQNISEIIYINSLDLSNIENYPAVLLPV